MAQEKPVVPVQKASQKVKPMEELVCLYFEVSKCWNDHSMAVRRKMTVEKAISILRKVRDQAWKHKGGKQLSQRAHKLLWDIVDLQVDGNIDEPNSARSRRK